MKEAREGWVLRLLLATAAAMLLPAASAMAAPQGPSLVDFQVEATDGFDLRFSGFTGNDFSALTLRRGRASATYLPRARARKITADRVRARFGERGRVSVRFRERSRHRIRHPRCRGFDLERRGVFVGRIRFNGERGYARVDAVRARGAVTSSGRVCRSRPRRAEGGRPFRRVGLESCISDQGPGYLAYRIRPGGRTLHWSYLLDRLPGLLVLREVVSIGGSQSLKTNRDLTLAKARPPGLFRGVGEYASEMLEGDLTAPFPGVGRVALTPADAALGKLRELDPPSCGPFSGRTTPVERAALPAPVRGSSLADR